MSSLPSPRSRRLLALAAAAPLVLGLAACGDDAAANSESGGSESGGSGAAEELRLGYFANVTHAAALVGVEQGLFEKELGDTKLSTQVFNAGPDVVEALERIYPCRVADIKPGRSRYALLLNERGHVMDDGMILRESESRFVLSFTSGGAANAEMWIRDWIDTWGLRVHVLDRTMSLAAINVTGPLAGELLQRAGLADPPRFLGHVHADIAGVPSHVMPLGRKKRGRK